MPRLKPGKTLHWRQMAKKILCTLGPASWDGPTIRRLEKCGTSLFRINLSHTRVNDVADAIHAIQQHTDVPICLDSEGAQIRTGSLVTGEIVMRANTIVRAHKRRVPGDDRNFNFYPADIIENLEIGDFISIDFNSVLVQVIDLEKNAVVMRVLNGGVVGQNKAVTVERDLPLPALTDKDRAALKIGRDEGLSHFALSFANEGANVDDIRTIVGDDAFVISKIESRNGLLNLEEIAAKSNALLIDRGDLSRQIPIELIPKTQKQILRRAKKVGIPVYVATNLLESMVSTPTPTRAEVNDIYNTLVDGADGLVLAAETAIGKYPIACASMIGKMMQSFEAGTDSDGTYYPADPISQLAEPNGGRLVHREATAEDLAELPSLDVLRVPATTLMDCEQIAFGTYSPLTGFMDSETLKSVLKTNHLPDGAPWSLPIVLQLDADAAATVSTGQRVALAAAEGQPTALLDITEIYKPDMNSLCEEFFGTASDGHPGVARVLSGGPVLVGGDVTLIRPPASPYLHYQLSPAHTRFIFTKLGWTQVVAFHGRNPPHRGHEAIQRMALDRTGADGLYINPVIGPKKPGDFLPDPIMESYQAMLDFGCYPQGRVVLGSFSTYSRYAGPREAVFTALCRKNMGCSHFIIGRDHTGVGDYYSVDANRELFDTMGDIGIEPVFFDPVGYNPVSGEYESAGGAALKSISGTEVRDTLKSGRELPEWFMRDIVQEVLLDYVASDRPLFYEE